MKHRIQKTSKTVSTFELTEREIQELIIGQLRSMNKISSDDVDVEFDVSSHGFLRGATVTFTNTDEAFDEEVIK